MSIKARLTSLLVNGLYALGCENDPMDIRLIFQSEEKQCLLYKGAIKENDIRTINSFEEYHVERSVGKSSFV